jgi:hypothetical protein
MHPAILTCFDARCPFESPLSWPADAQLRVDSIASRLNGDEVSLEFAATRLSTIDR